MAERPDEALSDFWRRHYGDKHAKVGELGVAASLDYPNERVRLQTYASLLEGLGELAGKRILDAGCGWGSLSLALHGCGAEVVGVDLVPETIAELRRRYPFIDWRQGDIADRESLAGLGEFAAVVVAEVLQCVDFDAAVELLWQKVAPGGRLVAALPNADCPIAQRVTRQLDERWRPVSPRQVEAAARRLGVAAAYLRGLDFRDDQTFQPYRASDWGAEIEGTPNRLVMVWLR